MNRTTTWALVALIAGLGFGIVQDLTHSAVLASVIRTIEPLGTIWVGAIRMTVIPLLVSLIIVGVTGVQSESVLGRLGLRSMVVFVTVLAVTAAVIALVAPWLFQPLRIDAGAMTDLRSSAATVTTHPASASLRDWVVSIVPTNPVRAAVDGALLPLFVFALLFALALRRVPRENASVLVSLLESVKDAATTLVGWVLAVAPIGVFALAAVIGARVGATAAGAIGYYLVVMCGLHVAVGLATYPLAALVGGVSVRTFAAAVAPTQIVAITSRSSMASLPAMYRGAEQLGVRTEDAGFVLPLAVSAFRLSSPVNWTVGALFVARLYGLPLEPEQIGLIALASVLLNPASPAVPSGGLFVQAPVYLAVGLPVEGLGILIALDAIPDIFKTLLNVTADLSVLTVIAPPGRAS